MNAALRANWEFSTRVENSQFAKPMILLCFLLVVEACQSSKQAHSRDRIIAKEFNDASFSECIGHFYPDTISMGMVCSICVEHNFHDQIEDAEKGFGLSPYFFVKEYLSLKPANQFQNLLMVSNECLL